jgi:hypothetical protein
MHWVNAIKSTRGSKKLCFDSITICTIRSGNNWRIMIHSYWPKEIL